MYILLSNVGNLDSDTLGIIGTIDNVNDAIPAIKTHEETNDLVFTCDTLDPVKINTTMMLLEMDYNDTAVRLLVVGDGNVYMVMSVPNLSI